MSALPVVGVDIGGTRIKVSVVSTSGVTLREDVVPTPRDIATSMARTVADLVHRVGPFEEERGAAHTAPAAVGVVVPGYVDEATGTGVWSANLGWRDLPIAELVRAEVGVPVRLGHDVRAGLLAERHFGAARGVDNAIFLPIGTGIAAATLVGGRVVSGHYAAGELGHVVLDENGAECGCGKRGCLEALASARAIGRNASALRGVELSAIDVENGVLEGDPELTGIWHTAVDHLARALAPAILGVGATHVIVGGGLVGAGATLLTPLTERLDALLPRDYGIAVVPAQLGDRAGALGAAALALHEIGVLQ